MTRFLAELKRESRRASRVFIDLSDVTEITSDGIAVLLAWIKDPRYPVLVGGNAPSDPRTRLVLMRSGFFQHISSPAWAGPTPFEVGIYQRDDYKVDPTLADRLVGKVTKPLFGRRRRSLGSYGTLIECMMNTHQHAAKDGTLGKERWWLTAYYEEGVGRAFFTFVDLGVGIFDSLKIKPLTALFKSNAALLRDILEGKVASSTGLKYRGKGLPKIYKFLQRNQIADLVIVSGNVYANVSENRFETLSPPFEGTLLNWEMSDTLSDTNRMLLP